MAEVTITEFHHPTVQFQRQPPPVRLDDADMNLICEVCFNDIGQRLYGKPLSAGDVTVITRVAGRGSVSAFALEIVVVVYSDDWHKVAGPSEDDKQAAYDKLAEQLGLRLQGWLPRRMPFSVGVKGELDGYWSGKGRKKATRDSGEAKTGPTG